MAILNFLFIYPSLLLNAAKFYCTLVQGALDSNGKNTKKITAHFLKIYFNDEYGDIVTQN